MVYRLPGGGLLEDREYTPAEVFEMVARAVQAELVSLINELNRRTNKAVEAEDHPMFVSGLREAAITVRGRAHALGVPVLIEDDITTPVDPEHAELFDPESKD